MPAKILTLSVGPANWKKIAATTSNAFAGQSQLMISTCSTRIVTPRAAASLRALPCALGEKTTDTNNEHQHRHTQAQQIRISLENRVRFRAEDILVADEALLPPIEVGLL